MSLLFAFILFTSNETLNQNEIAQAIEANLQVEKDLFKDLNTEHLSHKQLKSLQKNWKETKALGDQAILDLNVFHTISGYITFYNIIWISSAFIITIAVSALMNIYLLKLILAIHPIIWEIFFYTLCFGLIGCGFIPKLTFDGMYLALPGAIGLVPTLFYSKWLHHYNIKLNTAVSLGSGFLTIVWGICGILYTNQILGFMTVGALLTCLGFSVFVIPGCMIMGYKDKDHIPRTTAASFAIMCVYLAAEVFKLPMPYFNIFSTGALFLGTFVYYCTLLIISDKYYCKNSNVHYIWLQILTISSGIGALYIGSVFNVNLLLGIGGTFFYIYLIEKYYDIPWKGNGWAWSLLGLGLILYVGSIFAQEYPEFLLFV